MSSKEFDFEQFKAAVLKAMYTGKDGVLAPLIENLLNAALGGEMDSLMSSEEHESGNRRNGHISKQVQSSLGELTIQTPCDRESTFDPQIVQKRDRILADSLAKRILGMYAIGNTTSDIGDTLYEQFGNRISAETISAVTDRVLPKMHSLEKLLSRCRLSDRMDGCYSLQSYGRKVTSRQPSRI